MFIKTQSLFLCVCSLYHSATHFATHPNTHTRSHHFHLNFHSFNSNELFFVCYFYARVWLWVKRRTFERQHKNDNTTKHSIVIAEEKIGVKKGKNDWITTLIFQTLPTFNVLSWHNGILLCEMKTNTNKRFCKSKWKGFKIRVLIGVCLCRSPRYFYIATYVTLVNDLP